MDAYWGPRHASVEECARHALDFLICLGQWDESCSTWFETASSLKRALQRKVLLDLASLQDVLLRGRQYTDFGHRLMEELGYSMSIWNGRGAEEGDYDGIGISLRCGHYSRLVANACKITLPYQGPLADRLLQVPRLQALMRCVVLAWNPAWAVVRSSLDREISKQGLPPRRGWLLYIAQPWEKLPMLASSSEVVSCGPNGSIIIATQERFTAANQQHIEMAQQAITALDQAGLLTTIVDVPKKPGTAPLTGPGVPTFAPNDQIEKLHPLVDDFWERVLGVSYNASFVSNESIFDAWEHYVPGGRQELIARVKAIYRVDITEYYDKPIPIVLRIISEKSDCLDH